MMKIIYRFLLVVVCGTMLTACGSTPVEPLMPTPSLYAVNQASPIENIPESKRWKPRRVFYMTNRERDSDLQRISYSNNVSDKISMGVSLIGFGGPQISWADLDTFSRTKSRAKEINLSIAGIMEGGVLSSRENAGINPVGEKSWFLEELNSAIADAQSKDLLLYVPGTKVNFYNACAFAAQLDHFMGRKMTSLAFSWPSRQNIAAYVLGNDAQRSYDSARDLSFMLEFIATKTEVENIHIVTWSAGGRMVMTAMSELHKKSGLATAEEIKKKYKIGTVYFAAADVPGEEFLEALPNIKEVAKKIIVTSSTNDSALRSGRLFMGGEARIGEVRKDIDDEDLAIALGVSNLEVVNVSEGFAERGFDITGHRYWFNHPWASSDIILAIRYGLSAEDRGLKNSKLPILWSIPKDYPERLKGMRSELGL